MQVAANNRPETASALPPDITGQLPDVEREAVAMAREAGRIVSSLFGQSVQVDYKDDKQTDPVTAADLQSQSYLVQAITQHFPITAFWGKRRATTRSRRPARLTGCGCLTPWMAPPTSLTGCRYGASPSV